MILLLSWKRFFFFSKCFSLRAIFWQSSQKRLWKTLVFSYSLCNVAQVSLPARWQPLTPDLWLFQAGAFCSYTWIPQCQVDPDAMVVTLSTLLTWSLPSSRFTLCCLCAPGSGWVAFLQHFPAHAVVCAVHSAFPLLLCGAFSHDQCQLDSSTPDLDCTLQAVTRVGFLGQACWSPCS